jgi:hypothetical protein
MSDTDDTDHGFTLNQEKPKQKNGAARARRPHLLPASLLPVTPFDLELIPTQLRPWVADLCERLQCPGDYIGVSVVAGAGSVIGRKVLVRPQSAALKCSARWTEAGQEVFRVIPDRCGDDLNDVAQGTLP